MEHEEGKGDDNVLYLPNLLINWDTAVGDSLEVLPKLRAGWNEDTVDVKIFDEGITNKVFGFYLKSDTSSMGRKDMILFRIFGEKTEKVIDRKTGVPTIQMLNKAGIGPVLYCVFKNGLAYEFMRGVPLDKNSCREPKIMKMVATHFAEWHSLLKPPSDSLFDFSVPFPIAKTRDYLGQLSNFEGVFLDGDVASCVSIEFLKKELEELVQLTKIDEPMVFCHIDTLLANIIYDEENSHVRLIDYEYGGPCYRAFDIGNHFNEWCGIGATMDFSLFPPPQTQKQFIRYYLESYNSMKGLGAPSEKEVEKMYKDVGKMCLLSHFFWGIWGMLQSTISKIDFDYLQYCKDKLNEYFKQKHHFLSL